MWWWFVADAAFLWLASLEAWKVAEGISRNFLATLLRGCEKYEVEPEDCGSGETTGVSSESPRVRLRPRSVWRESLVWRSGIEGLNNDDRDVRGAAAAGIMGGAYSRLLLPAGLGLGIAPGIGDTEPERGVPRIDDSLIRGRGAGWLSIGMTGVCRPPAAAVGGACRVDCIAWDWKKPEATSWLYEASTSSRDGRSDNPLGFGSI